MVKLALTRLALPQCTACCAFHCALLRRGGRGLLLVGPSGSGKSTLAAALARKGLSVLADDTAVLLPSLRLRGLPLGICLKEGSWLPLAGHVPDLAWLPIHTRLDRKTVRYLPLTEEAAEGVVVTDIVFPQFVPGVPSSLRVPGRAEALTRLIESCVPLAEPLGPSLLERLIGWIEGIRCVTLRHGDLEIAVNEIGSRMNSS